MIVTAVKAKLEDIQSLRALFLQESNFQVRYNACHERGWTDSYLLTADDTPIGYGSIKGQERDGRDTVFEFYLVPTLRKESRVAFAELLAASGAKYIECQSNDALLSSMLFEFARDINADTVLFSDQIATELNVEGAQFRPRTRDDEVFHHRVEPLGDYVLEVQGEIVATGGFLTHYNPPFADLYMEVRPDCRGRGYASFILQEVKKACYSAGRVPAARCGIGNKASRGALLKAGMKVCGFMLLGHVRPREIV
ncbi:MAG TPA: GNAT family N-acetyltransferase [Candidatus Angelobacter sp.]|nr:GNAT family N-acetyltransferase [Candidatus Angelobacter sp.]